MAQGLRGLTALAEDLGSVPRTHMVAHNSLTFSDLHKHHVCMRFINVGQRLRDIK